MQRLSSCSSWIWFVLFTFALWKLVLKYHDQDPYNNQLAAVESQNKQAYINMIKPGYVVYWEVTMFLNSFEFSEGLTTVTECY